MSIQDIEQNKSRATAWISLAGYIQKQKANQNHPTGPKQFKSFRSTLKSEVAVATIARVIIAKDKNKRKSQVAFYADKIKWMRKVKVMLKDEYKS